MRVLLTGAAGFIGHHVLARLLESPSTHVTAFVKMDKIGDMRRIKEVCKEKDLERVQFVWHDLRSPITRALGGFDYILHFAAETHVDRSIEDPASFVQSNVLGTLNLLNYARQARPFKFLYFSTDEVFGPAPHGVEFSPDDVHRPNNPYAASKSAAEQLVRAYANTYGMNAMVLRSMNVFGERQHPEKFIPMCIRKILQGEEILIHASKEMIPGSRFYIYAKDVADAAMHALTLDTTGTPAYHVVGEKEIDNLSLANMISEIVGYLVKTRLVDFHSSRPGHDLRYAIKHHLPGWERPASFRETLAATVEWYLSHKEWLDGK